MAINLIMAANDVALGVMTAGDFVLLQAYFMQLSGPLFNMGVMFREAGQTQVDMEDMIAMLERQPKIQDLPNAADFKFHSGSIKFENITFGHLNEKKTKNGGEQPTEEKKYLFRDLTLSMQPGTTNAIVGPSGFGKTTLLQLLFRMYDPEQGRVTIDGQDLKECKMDSFRRLITVIPQNGVLFNDTVRFNLQYGNPDATQEEIEAIAKKCHLHEKIMSMPDGYDSQVGDLGAKLSGGERQRILIGRGLLKKDSQIYLFDEASSNLDSRTEKEIAEWLEEIMKGKTVIYCAHRLSSIINVDKIHVLSSGKLVEQGTHQELISDPNSTYSQMWQNYIREKTQPEV